MMNQTMMNQTMVAPMRKATDDADTLDESIEIYFEVWKGRSPVPV